MFDTIHQGFEKYKPRDCITRQCIGMRDSEDFFCPCTLSDLPIMYWQDAALQSRIQAAPPFRLSSFAACQHDYTFNLFKKIEIAITD
jgi:hypothetical protein